jgi:ketosteroid isomerase-like protein
MATAARPLTASDSTQLHMIKEAFRASVDDGFEAGLETLLGSAHEDCEFRPYIGNDQVIRGHDEIRRYYSEVIASGAHMRLNPTSFHEDGDHIVVHGSIRIARASGGFSEAQISWTYSFRDGRLASAGWRPRQPA